MTEFIFVENLLANGKIYTYIGLLLNFLFQIQNAEEVNHLDCNTHNNSASNLEWVTREENLGYAVVYGFMTRDALGRFCRKLA